MGVNILLEQRRIFFASTSSAQVMKIYTKTGDKGKTSLGSGARVWKNSVRVDAYGTIDELNSLLGVIVSELKEASLRKLLIEIQKDLFSIGAYISNPQRENMIANISKKTQALEKQIDEMTAILPELHNFILPGGGRIGALLQVARTISRRAERRLVDLLQSENIQVEAVSYINRLSDLLFTASRFVNYKQNKKEIIWKRNG